MPHAPQSRRESFLQVQGSDRIPTKDRADADILRGKILALGWCRLFELHRHNREAIYCTGFVDDRLPHSCRAT